MKKREWGKGQEKKRKELIILSTMKIESHLLNVAPPFMVSQNPRLHSMASALLYNFLLRQKILFEYCNDSRPSVVIITFSPSREIHKDKKLESHFYEPNSPLEMRLHATERKPVRHMYRMWDPAQQLKSANDVPRRRQRQTHRAAATWLASTLHKWNRHNPPSLGATAQARHTQTLPLTASRAGPSSVTRSLQHEER